MNGENSRLQDVLSGVPQGSVHGPTLFLMFVNDIDAAIYSHIQKFADDCKVYRSVPTTQDIVTLQQDIEKVQVGKDQEKAQSEKDSHSKHRGGKKTKLTIRYLYHETYRKPNEQLFSQ